MLSLLKWPFSIQPLMLFQHVSTSVFPTTDAHFALLQMLACGSPEVPEMSAGRNDSVRHKHDLKEIINCRSVAVRGMAVRNLGHLSLMKSVKLLVFLMWELLYLFSS